MLSLKDTCSFGDVLENIGCLSKNEFESAYHIK